MRVKVHDARAHPHAGLNARARMHIPTPTRTRARARTCTDPNTHTRTCTDLWAERDCTSLIDSFVAAGACSADISDPSPYLPGHTDFGTDIGIIYTTLMVQKS